MDSKAFGRIGEAVRDEPRGEERPWSGERGVGSGVGPMGEGADGNEVSRLGNQEKAVETGSLDKCVDP